MKTFNLTTFIFFLNLICYSQVNQYNKPLTVPHYNTQPKIDAYEPIDYSYLQNQLEKRQAIYDANLKRLNDLQRWIIDLNNWSNYYEFSADLKPLNDELNAMKNKDLSLPQYSNYLTNIHNQILISIDKENARINNPQTYITIADNYFTNKDFSNAIKNYSIAIKIDSNNTKAYFYRGYSFYKTNNFNNALADFNKTIQLNTTFVDAYFARARTKGVLNDHNGAIADYKKCVELEPSNSMAFNNLAWEYFILKDYKLALTYVNRSLQLDSKNFTALDSRAEIKFNLNDYSGCIEDANAALVLNPKLSNSFFLLGRANYRLNNKTKACEYWGKSGELGNIEAYEYISKYCN